MKENYDLITGRYKAGVGHHLELKDAEVTLRSAKLEYFGSLRDYNVAVSALEKSIGHSLEEEKM